MKNFFWAKTTEDGKPGISVTNHLLNVGYVAQLIAHLSENIIERFKLSAAEAGAIAALHDIGKISPGFQLKCKMWVEENSLLEITRNERWDALMESDHGKVTQQAIQSFLSGLQTSREMAAYLPAVIGGHHGRLNQPNLRWPQPLRMNKDTENKSGIDWENERRDVIERIWKKFAIGTPLPEISNSNPALWWIAGLTSVADWIASNELFFPTNKTTTTNDRSEIASAALADIGFKRIEILKGFSFHDLFYEKEKPEIIWKPNEMQQKVLSTITGPGVYIIEAPMGMGKTEAALWATYNLLCEKKANGIYFALPTQATSNRIHIRINDFIERIAPSAGKSRLIHANSWLSDKKELISPGKTGETDAEDDARKSRDWFSSAKRAMLAPFGVGTVDQALLGVVAAKHFFVRLFALAGKAVIIDEVHSYDFYTGSLIDKLITTLEDLGCTVIILSATLTGKRRGQIVTNSAVLDVDDSKEAYPLITGRKEGVSIRPVEVEQSESKEVQICFKTADTAAHGAISLAEKGGRVIWICNTVDEAQKQYRKFESINKNGFTLGLLHSRFPFWRREQIENVWMERLGKEGRDRCGSILVSTQIVEQSVDLDADLMISELAPTDMLLQRLGRLWRHERIRPNGLHARLIIISEQKNLEDFRMMKPKEILESLGPKSSVYEPIVLLRSLQEWKKFENKKIIIPKDIRTILEATYDESIENPESWEKLFDERFIRNSNERFKAALNSNYWQQLLPDEEGVQTRLNDMPAVSLVLCKEKTEKHIIFIDEEQADFRIEKFQLSTAQAIHKNIVKVPICYFDVIEDFKHFSEYVRGVQTIGRIDNNGFVVVKGLKDSVSLFYSDISGLVIYKPASWEDK